ncbi:flavodoxin family protein [Bombilactobacillus bombi]|uniref:flavodoxin family protein n=1 Tax=Bombilactobacillus bombi TaxID=1303590 RepID=UPI0015E607BD|nr:flavodoxin family protein [Bombilactobacillus bombi]MBA1434684.1 hypothetical protein [Bombilactobacillus bombi]
MDAIRYYSRTGNTEKMAQYLAEQLGIPAQTIEQPLAQPVTRLFIGGGIYSMSPDNHLKDFVRTLSPDQVQKVYLFGTAGSAFTIEKGLSKILKKQKIPVSEKHVFLHGVMPKLGNISDRQKEEIKKFVAEINA